MCKVSRWKSPKPLGKVRKSAKVSDKIEHCTAPINTLARMAILGIFRSTLSIFRITLKFGLWSGSSGYFVCSLTRRGSWIKCVYDLCDFLIGPACTTIWSTISICQSFTNTRDMVLYYLLWTTPYTINTYLYPRPCCIAAPQVSCYVRLLIPTARSALSTVLIVVSQK